MPDYLYKASSRAGELRSGTLQAPSQEAVQRRLRSQGLMPLQIEEAQAGAAGAAAAAPVAGRRAPRRDPAPGFRDVLAITGELATMLRAGLPLDRALKVLIGMNERPRLKALLVDILEAVKGGKGLSQALLPHQRLFGDFYINMVRSGEASGHLGEVLTRLAEHLERTRVVRASLVSALTYPAILVVVALISVVVMLGFVVPQFELLFADMGEALPWPTRIIIGAGDWIAAWGIHALIVLLLGVALLQRWRNTDAGRLRWDTQMLRLPLFGAVLLKYEVSRFARTMGTLLGNGVSILHALDVAADTVGNTRLRGALARIKPDIKQGGRLAAALEKTALFTPMVIQMAQVGEETGRLDDMLLEVARIYDDEVQTGVKRALTLLEPLLILVLGAVIAAIIVSILLGILSVNDLAI